MMTTTINGFVVLVVVLFQSLVNSEHELLPVK
jgi:hypothetical protein